MEGSEEMNKRILIVIVTVLFVLSTVLLIQNMYHGLLYDNVYRGEYFLVSNLKYYENFEFQSTDGVALVEAVSSKPFILRSDSWSLISGEKETPPLGWPYKEYWRSKPQTIDIGRWFVQKGSKITVHFIDRDIDTRLERDLEWFQVMFVFLQSLILVVSGIILSSFCKKRKAVSGEQQNE